MPTEVTSRQSEQFYRSLYENSTLGMYRTTPDGRILMANPALVKLLGYDSFEELAQRNLEREGYEPGYPRLEFQQRIERDGKVVGLESSWRRKDGLCVYVRESAFLVRDENGRSLYYEGTVEDITERTQAEYALRESEAKFRNLFENSVMGISQSLPDGRLIYINEAYAHMYGYENPELMMAEVSDIGKQLYENPEDRTEVLRILQKNGVMKPREISVRHRDGTPFTVLVGAREIRNSNGDLICYQAEHIDITSRKQAEQAMQESEEKYRLLVERANEAILVAQDGMLKMVNPMASQLTGYTEQELISKPFSFFIHPEDREMVVTNYMKRLKGAELPPRYSFRLATRDGGIRWVEISAVLVDWQGRPATLNFISDVTNRMQAEQVLRSSQDETAHANRLLLALSQAAHAVQRSLTPQQVYTAIQDQINQLGYYATGLEFSADGHRLAITYINYAEALIHKAEKLTGLSLRSFHFRPRVGTVYQRVITNDETVFIADPAQAVADALPSRLRALGRPVASLFKLESSIFAPLKVGNQTIGVFAVTGPDLTPADVPAITAFAHQAAIAMLNARLFEQAQNEINERRQAEEALRRSEQRFRAIIEHSYDAVTLLSADGTVLYDSPSITQILGYGANERLGRKVFEFISPEKRAGFKKVYAKFASQFETTAISEAPFRHKDGSERLIEGVRNNLLKDPIVQAVVVNYHDITERRREQALRDAVYRIALATETTSSLDDLYQQIHQIIATVMPAENFYITLYDQERNVLHFPYFKDVQDEPYLGEIQPGLGLTAYVLRTGKSLLCTQAIHDELERQGAVKLLGVPSAIWLGVPLIREGKTIGAMVVQHYSDPDAYSEREQHMLEFVSTQVAIAISRKQVEEALIQSEEKFRLLAEKSVFGVYIIQDSKMAYVNPGMARIFGYLPDEISGRLAPKDLIHPDDIQVVTRRIQERLDGQVEGNPITYKGVKKDGSLIYIEVYGVATEYQGRPAVMGTLVDVTERVRAEQALRESEQRYRDIFDGVQEAIFVESMDGRILAVNQGACRMYGYEPDEFIKKTAADLVPPGNPVMKQPTENAALTLEPIETINRRADGELFPIEISGQMQMIDGEQVMLVVVRDITERRQAEQALQEYNARLEAAVETRTLELREIQEKLIRQERLAALGQLAGGVGHELRNPLGVIATSIYYLKLVQPEASEKVRQHLNMIEQEVHTAEKIISDLLDFGRVLTAAREPLSVSELVHRVLARFPVPASIKVVKNIPASLPRVFADPVQMEQVLGNLVINACQAMTAPSAMMEGGRLTISAQPREGMIAIRVKDTGAGISTENMPKIFEPLFTTKARGIGLGLAVSQKLVQVNGGRIEVQSQPGKGSTFTLLLPARTAAEGSAG